MEEKNWKPLSLTTTFFFTKDYLSAIDEEIPLPRNSYKGGL
jgi:hypothetical protein